MNRKISFIALLVLALLCFLGTAALYYNYPGANEGQDQASEIATITKKVHQCIDKAHHEAATIGAQLQKPDVTFTSLLKKTEYPTFVYRKGELIFWSHHTIVPELGETLVGNRPTAISNEYGTFIVVPERTQGYDIDVYVPLLADYQTSNTYLAPELKDEVFEEQDVQLDWNPSSAHPRVYTQQGDFLFAVNMRRGGQEAPESVLLLVLFCAGLLFYIFFVILLFRYLAGKEQYNKAIGLLLLLLGLLRLLLLALNLPFALFEIDLFNPRFYAASFLSPSIGDLLLNMVLLALVAWSGLYLFRKNRLVAQLKELSRSKSRQLQTGCILIFYLLLLLLFQFYFNIYHNSPLVLDVSRSLDFTWYKAALYSVMFIHTVALSIFTYMLATVVSVLVAREQKLVPYKQLVLLSGFLLLLSSFLVQPLAILVLIGFLFWLIIIFAAQNQNAVSWGYRTFLFFFLVVIVSSLTGGLSLYAHYHSELKIYKQKFAFNILQENDVLAEYLLMSEDVAGRIAGDEVIQMKMKGPYVDASFIKRKIKKQYLPSYFDKYEVNVQLFDSRGNALEVADTASASLQELLRRFNTPQAQTEHEGLFLLQDPMRYNARVYLKLIEVPVHEYQNGYIALQLTLKRLLPNSVVPELLVDQNYAQPFRTDMLSYAIYEDSKLRYSEGEYDYATNFNRRLLRRSELYRNGVNLGNYHHFGVRNGEGQRLIITTEKYGGKELLSNFSFLFLSFIAGMLVLGLLYTAVQRQRLQDFSPDFSAKIQIFLNFGIILPLLLVSIATASLVTASYKKDLMSTYEQRGEAIQKSLAEQLQNGLLEDKRRLEERIGEIASISETDINLYDSKGKLLVTSQPLIFEAGLLSKLINPEAFAAIAERQALRVLLEEQAGNLNFNAVYLPLRYENNPTALAGFIGIPFFDSEKELDLKLIELTTTTMNIFTVMFIVFLVLTFFASRALTVPLRILADKLNRTSLTGKNEMLAYEGADEIGMLVKEYNRMLLTLEQNKQDLAMQEKEAAWREMARQVAHEIKNPLTPMKLSLQYLQKAIAEKRPNTEQLIDKISQTLISQINILSDIATSFSSFTSMPEPKAELMDISAALQKAADLHNDPAAAVIEKDIQAEEVVVKADENLMVRTFNNLLLNAIQAVPASRKPHIKIGLELQPDKTVLISIQDNGSGIPVDIRGKVFIPNFSTKYTGSGIGLAVAKRGIENAGGRIWFETEEGQGTTFFISLPLAGHA
ncbi:HAMP domain-containing protein [Pontibacter ummariensis]|uniref:histidine kinase n=1 Tax=Pontibacter ummariensis TaxID=1610492 RepID=A0A239KXW1_9BACT|nr:HAMP domain-containing sensor histidine kinase [Pontibacter ummariensis]PRY04940.1 HAMP domain-containing protein [Pontibacter ummariensis]SNT22339.1 HAMP domain-containing protein [Pontibacter ummariensis]